MALQASGPIKYSEIVEEFGSPASNTTTTFFNVPWVKWYPQTDWVKSSALNNINNINGIWSSFMKDYAVYPSNTDPLIGTHSATWRIYFPAGSYTIEVQSDDGATIKLDGDNLVSTVSIQPELNSATQSFTITDATQHYIEAIVTNDGGAGSGWGNNPGGVAWKITKNSDGSAFADSTQSFNYSVASTGWGSFLNTYGVYPSATSSLTDTWHETNYLFNGSAGTHTIEGVADSQSEFYLDDGSGETLVLTTSANENCSTGACNSDSLGTLSNQVYKLRVRVRNGGNTGGLPTNLWLHNPGGVAFIIRNSSGTIIKSSTNTGGQGSISLQSGSVKFGNYRMDNASEFGGMIVPLDTDCGPNSNVDIPIQNNPISFSDFYNSRLNIAVNYYTVDENRPLDAVSKFGNPSNRRIVGAFRGYPNDTSESKVALVVNKIISAKLGGVAGSSVNECSLRTGGGWASGTKVTIQVGPSGRIYGAGGDGGTGGDVNGDNRNPSDGSVGENGTSAIGIQYNNTVIKVRSGGNIVTGYGGGGGGGGAFEDSTPQTGGWGPFGGNNDPRPRCGSGGGGGGGAGSPAGSGGATGTIQVFNPSRFASTGNSGSTGSIPDDGEQGGAGGSGGNNAGEAVGGIGGRGRDGETSGSGFDNDGTGQDSQGNTSSGSYEGSNGGSGGSDGAAIRRLPGYTVTINNNGDIDGETTATGVS